MIQKIAKASVMHPAWAEYDRGTWTDEQVLAAFVKDAPQLEQELYQAFTSIAGIVTPRAYAIPWLQELKEKGYHVYYLSNFSHKASLYRSSYRIQFHDLQQLLRRRRHRHFRIPYNTELSLRYHFI